MMSRRGIFHDIKNSIYIYKDGDIKYFFSSKYYLNKFISQIKLNREIINLSLSNRFKLDIEVDCLADIVLYNKIETRGFYIEIMEDKRWQESTTLGGVIKIAKS